MTHRRQARGSTRAYVQVHKRLPHGHQGIRHIGPHHREAACFMGPHVQHLTCLGASVLTPAPHSLRTAPRGPVWPMHHSGGLCMCRANQWLAIGLHTIQWTTEAWLAAAGHTSHGLGADWPDTVPRRRSGWASSTATGACPVVDTCVNWTCSLPH